MSRYRVACVGRSRVDGRLTADRHRMSRHSHMRRMPRAAGFLAIDAVTMAADNLFAAGIIGNGATETFAPFVFKLHIASDIMRDSLSYCM